MKIKTYFWRILIFLFGLFVGWSICSINQPVTGEQRDDSPDLGVLGVKFDFGAQARQHSSIAGIEIPTNAIDCFYGIGGLKPVIEYIAFTLPTREVWPFVKSISGKQKSDLQPLINFQGPKTFGTDHCNTLLFNPSGITPLKGVSWEIKNHLEVECVVDEDSGRIYFQILGD